MKGKKQTDLPVMEHFYTIQGEGYHTGKAAFFLRIGGCDVSCKWCDVKESWNADHWPPLSIDSIVKEAIKYPAKALVVTGGEPLMYNLSDLTTSFKAVGYQTFVETSGCYQISGEWDWICLSPKKNHPPLTEIEGLAHELKVIIETVADFEWAEQYASKVSEACKLFLQPEWSVHNKIMPEIIDYIKRNPQWSISLQTHKFMQIP